MLSVLKAKTVINAGAEAASWSYTHCLGVVGSRWVRWNDATGLLLHRGFPRDLKKRENLKILPQNKEKDRRFSGVRAGRMPRPTWHGAQTSVNKAEDEGRRLFSKPRRGASLFNTKDEKVCSQMKGQGHDPLDLSWNRGDMLCNTTNNHHND